MVSLLAESHRILFFWCFLWGETLLKDPSSTQNTQYFGGTFMMKPNSLLSNESPSLHATSLFSNESSCLHATFVCIFILAELWSPRDSPHDRHLYSMLFLSQCSWAGKIDRWVIVGLIITSMRTWVQIPDAHIESGVWLHMPITTALGVTNDKRIAGVCWPLVLLQVWRETLSQSRKSVSNWWTHGGLCAPYIYSVLCIRVCVHTCAHTDTHIPYIYIHTIQTHIM